MNSPAEVVDTERGSFISHHNHTCEWVHLWWGRKNELIIMKHVNTSTLFDRGTEISNNNLWATDRIFSEDYSINLYLTSDLQGRLTVGWREEISELLKYFYNNIHDLTHNLKQITLFIRLLMWKCRPPSCAAMDYSIRGWCSLVHLSGIQNKHLNVYLSIRTFASRLRLMSVSLHQNTNFKSVVIKSRTRCLDFK